MQEVLSAHRTVQVGTKPAKGEKPAEAPAAFIPIPENNGVVDNYDQLYQANRWTDPVSYVCSSTTADEYIINGISDGFTYYMDERDQPWLEKNNEEARGEGTSAQGAVSGTPTRLVRSAKSKGKEPDLSQPVVITEDEFELVMGIFEYVTHEKTEYLHHVCYFVLIRLMFFIDGVYRAWKLGWNSLLSRIINPCLRPLYRRLCSPILSSHLGYPYQPHS